MDRSRQLIGALAGAASLLLVLALVACQPTSSGDHGALADPHWFLGRVLYEMNVPELSDDGTLTGLIPHLDRLHGLGLEVVVLDPIHPRGGQAPGDTQPAHPYSVRDHLGVAADLGGLPALEGFIAAAHERGMRVVLDMVLNHGAVDHVLMAEHEDWFAHDQHGRLTRAIPRWQSVADFQHADPRVQDYWHRVLTTWAERGVDGFRFVHGNLIAPEIWPTVLDRLRRRCPHLYLLADAKNPRLLDVGFHGVFRPQYFESCTFAFMDDLAQPGLQDDMWFAAVDTSIDLGVRGTTFVEGRFTNRAAVMFPWPRGQGYVAALLTLPGTPKLYNGQEWGLDAPPRLVGAQRLQAAAADTAWSRLYRDLLALRTHNEALRVGETTRVPCRQNELLVFTRQAGQDLLLVAVNLTDTAPTFDLPRELAGRQWQPWQGDAFAGPSLQLPARVRVPPCGYRVWKTTVTVD